MEDERLHAGDKLIVCVCVCVNTMQDCTRFRGGTVFVNKLDTAEYFEKLGN